MKGEIYKGIVEKVVQGAHGPYGVVRHADLGSVTFSLLPPVWNEEDVPECGMEVETRMLRKKRGGWRAMRAWYVQPTITTAI